MLNKCQLQFEPRSPNLTKLAESSLFFPLGSKKSFAAVIFLDDIDRPEQLIWAFHVWLESFDAVDNEERLLDSLSRCQERLPAQLCRDFGLPAGSTYAAAAELFLSLWVDAKHGVGD